LSRLHYLLREMHDLRTSCPQAFHDAYATTVREVVKLAGEADFEGHGMPRSGEPPSALHFAAGCGCLEACAALLLRCGRLNFAVDPAGQTPLFWAAQSGLCNTLRLLLQQGADVAHGDAEGRSSLHVAAARGLVDTCRILLRAPCAQHRTLESRTKRGFTPLHVAVTGGHERVAELLLEARAEVRAETPEGRTALHLAAMEGHEPILARLLAVGPELQRAEDGRGWRAFDYARARGQAGSAEALRSEERTQTMLHSQWRQLFEPSCRARLNVPACEAFLEIGRPRLLGASAHSLRLVCRVVDAFGLVQRYSLELVNPGRASGPVEWERQLCVPAQPVRHSSRTHISDVELAVCLLSAQEPLWERLEDCCFRVVVDLVPEHAARLGLEGWQARSPWASPLRIGGDSL